MSTIQAQPKPPKRLRDPAYLARVRKLPCLMAGVSGAGPCFGGVQADHCGERGMGCKADDDTAVPMCAMHHKDRHCASGYFHGRNKAWLRSWKAEAIRRTQARLGTGSARTLVMAKAG